MADRNFELPGIHELSKEQEAARMLKNEGRHLIIGGPGTGKSVVALMRARRHHRAKEDYVFLVYNRLLHQASRRLFGEKLASQTWKSWFGGKFREMTGQALTLLPSEQQGDWRDIDWDRVLGLVRPAKGDLPFLIIDEGQDMPPEFYKALIGLGFRDIYVVADQNQAIVEGQNSSRQDIEDALVIAPNNVLELRTNYRNSYTTARLAREFYTGDPASPAPELPSNQRSAKRPVLVEYGTGKKLHFQAIVRRILKTADRGPSKLIGVICPNNQVRERYIKALNSAKPQLDNGKPHIQTYKSGDRAELSFDKGGIMVINAQSCKGLEFDTVLLADIDQHWCRAENMEEQKRLFYVMVARAKERVVILRNADKDCPVEPILPTNPEILGKELENGAK
jgi:DNA helicase II / ATP-dependent DNA helicase PcrA